MYYVRSVVYTMYALQCVLYMYFGMDYTCTSVCTMYVFWYVLVCSVVYTTYVPWNVLYMPCLCVLCTSFSMYSVFPLACTKHALRYVPGTLCGIDYICSEVCSMYVLRHVLYMSYGLYYVCPIIWTIYVL